MYISKLIKLLTKMVMIGGEIFPEKGGGFTQKKRFTQKKKKKQIHHQPPPR